METYKLRDHKQILVRRSTSRTFLGLVVSLLLVALSAFAALAVITPVSAPFTDLTASDSLIILIFTAAGAVVFTALLIFHIRQLISPNPLVVIDSVGITDHTSWLSVGAIRWDEIAAIVATKRYIAITPQDIEPILARQHPIKRVILSINAPFTGYAIIIPGLLMSTSTSDVLRQAMTSYSDQILEHGIRTHITQR